jgi:hypothetical protein
MDVEVTINDNGVPTVEVPALLDWLDVQIAALETAKLASSETVGTYLQNVQDSYTELKEELSKTTMEILDGCSAR